MALGTLVSRLTGFLRTLLLAYAIGAQTLGNAYNDANTLPNVVYDLMLGGILTSVVVPLLVTAARRDPDHGDSYFQRMFTLGVIALGAITLVATLAAALIVDLYAGAIHGAEHHVMVVFAYFFIPQIFFYGVSSLAGAILNARGRFAAPMWTPVINNVVVILILLMYVAVAGLGRTPATITSGQVLLLGIGTTLGIVAQTAALIPSLLRCGFRPRPTFGFRRAEVAEIGRMAGWLSGYVITTQVTFFTTVRVATDASRTRPGRRVRRVHVRLPAVPDALRDHRHLGDHRAAAADGRARHSPPLLPGQGGFLHRHQALGGDRGAVLAAARRARRPARRSCCSRTAARRWRTRTTSARCSRYSRSAWSPT